MKTAYLRVSFVFYCLVSTSLKGNDRDCTLTETHAAPPLHRAPPKLLAHAPTDSLRQKPPHSDCLYILIFRHFPLPHPLSQRAMRLLSCPSALFLLSFVLHNTPASSQSIPTSAANLMKQAAWGAAKGAAQAMQTSVNVSAGFFGWEGWIRDDGRDGWRCRAYKLRKCAMNKCRAPMPAWESKSRFSYHRG